MDIWTIIKTFDDELAFFNNLSVALGVVLAVILYAKNQFVRSYEQLNDRFLDFLHLQLSHPNLGTNTIDRHPVQSSAAQALIFEYLLSLLERAFFFSNTGIDRYFCWKRREWDTWNKWVDEYLKNPNFVRFWDQVSSQSCYDERFQRYLNKKLPARAHRRD